MEVLASHSVAKDGQPKSGQNWPAQSCQSKHGWPKFASQMLVETGLDGSVWNFLAGNRNPGLNRDGPDGFLAGFRGGRRPTYRGGLGGGSPPSSRVRYLSFWPAILLAHCIQGRMLPV